jgi:hypothetical protein
MSEVFIPADLKLSSINVVRTEEWAFLTEDSRNDSNCPLQDNATEHTLVAVSKDRIVDKLFLRRIISLL